MEINDTYEIKIENIQHFVYEGTCDGIPTKWVTKTKWDGKIKIQMLNNKEIKYTDSSGDEILVFDEEDVEYKYIRK
jgi:hypothetical protein